MSLPRVIHVYATVKAGHVSLELDCGCIVPGELTAQWASSPNVLLGTSRPLHRCETLRSSADSEIALGERIGRQMESLARSGDDEEVVSERLN